MVAPRRASVCLLAGTAGRTAFRCLTALHMVLYRRGTAVVREHYRNSLTTTSAMSVFFVTAHRMRVGTLATILDCQACVGTVKGGADGGTAEVIAGVPVSFLAYSSGAPRRPGVWRLDLRYRHGAR